MLALVMLTLSLCFALHNLHITIMLFPLKIKIPNKLLTKHLAPDVKIQQETALVLLGELLKK